MKQKINISFFIISVFLICYTSSCVEDKGNYDYEAMSKVEMEYPKTPFDPAVQIEQTGKLIIDPEITITEGIGKDSFYFEWFLSEVIVGQGSRAFGDIKLHLSQSETTPVLDIELPEEMKVSKTYVVVFRATNSLTGLAFTKGFEVTVQDRLQTGYLAISEKDSGVELDMIASFKIDGIEELTLQTNLLQTKGSAFPSEGRKPIGIYTFDDTFAPSPVDANPSRIKYSVYLLTDKNTDRLRPEDYSFIEGSYNISQMAYIPARYEPDAYIAQKLAYHSGRHYYAYMGGNWFFMNMSPVTVFFMFPVNMYKGEDVTYKTPPFIARAQSGAVIFNEDDNCFMHHKYSSADLTSTKNLFQTVRFTDNVGDAFEFNNPNYELIHLANSYNDANPSTKNYDIFAIVKERTTGEYELLTFSMNSAANIVAKSKSRKIIPNSINIPDVKYYSYHPSEPILYMGTEDKVYRVITTTSSVDVRDITSEVVPAGHKVSCLKNMYKKDARPVLAIATYNASGSLNTAGTLKMYEINTQNGNLTLAKHPKAPAANGYQINMEWTGLGKVVDIEFKDK